MNSVENVENFSSFMAGVFLTRREISCSELSYLMNDYSIKMNSCIVEDDDEFYMFNNFIHFDNKKIFVNKLSHLIKSVIISKILNININYF